jgi:SAM-dependent methyltransferase
MSTGYRDSHLAPNKGISYHRMFSENPYRTTVWHLEQDCLDRILKAYYEDEGVSHLDFACGTGRILSHLADRASVSVGVDLSPSMLEVARKNLNDVVLHEADITRNDVLGDQKFNLVTAFRFFPNAEPELRLEAMRTLAEHLDDEGYFVFNNHKNTASSRNRLARLFGRHGYQGMSVREVQDLLVSANMEIVQTYHLCVLPLSEEHMLLPRFLLRPAEGLLARCAILRSLGENLIFVCRRVRSTGDRLAA